MPSFVTKVSTPVSPGISSAGTENNNSGTVFFGRVVDIVLSNDHPDYDLLGKDQSLYGVYFQPLNPGAPEKLPDPIRIKRFAYCGQSNIKQIPVKGEIVSLQFCPAGPGLNSRSAQSEKIYWLQIVPVWNSINNNLCPDPRLFEVSGKIDTGEFIQQRYKPLQLAAGDVAFEGRQGQSIRFGGTKGSGKISSKGTNGAPFIAIRIGSEATGSSVSSEDVNADGSSIYITKGRAVDLTLASTKFAGSIEDPAEVKAFEGNQIAMSSGQVIANAKESNLELIAKESIIQSAKDVSIDGENYVGLDAKKIYLGTVAQSEKEPVLRGQTSVDFLTNIINTLCSFLSNVSVPAPPAVWTSNAAVQSLICSSTLKSYLSGINNLKSEKVFVE